MGAAMTFEASQVRKEFTRIRSRTKLRALRSAFVIASGLMLADHALAMMGAPSTPAEPVTFSNQIVRIFQENCQTCHREGGIAPFSLTTYEAAYPVRNTIA